jgi:hypothetical protein
VDELVDWCDQNVLELNVTKTEELVIDFRRNKGSIAPLVIKGEEVRTVNQYKYLGTVIDDRLKWTANIAACHKKTSQRMFFLRKLKQFKVNSNILYLFYQSVVQSIILYNQLCYYNNASKADTERLNRITAAARKVTMTPSTKSGHPPPSTKKQACTS